MYLFKSILTFVFLIFLLASNTVSASHFELGKRFFDYGNGAINLDNVSAIRHRIKYRITLPGDSELELFKEYGTAATKPNIESTLNFIKYRSLAKAPFYYIKINSSVFFDDFELYILSEKEFLKIPKPKQIRETQSKYPIFMQFVKTCCLGGLVFHSSVTPKEQYMNLLEQSKTIKELTKKDYNIIEYALEHTLDAYKTAVE